MIVDVLSQVWAQDIGVIVEHLEDGRHSAHPGTLMGFKQRDFPYIQRFSILTCSQYYRETPLFGWVIQDMLSCTIQRENFGARHSPGTLLSNFVALFFKCSINALHALICVAIEERAIR